MLFTRGISFDHPEEDQIYHMRKCYLIGTNASQWRHLALQCMPLKWWNSRLKHTRSYLQLPMFGLNFVWKVKYQSPRAGSSLVTVVSWAYSHNKGRDATDIAGIPINDWSERLFNCLCVSLGVTSVIQNDTLNEI